MDRCEICGARWGIGDNQQWGRHNLMVTAAHRYCLGRQTYIVSDCVRWLLSNWHEFERETRERIIRETEEAIEKGCAGGESDIELWKMLIKDGIIEDDI